MVSCCWISGGLDLLVGANDPDSEESKMLNAAVIAGIGSMSLALTLLSPTRGRTSSSSEQANELNVRRLCAMCYNATIAPDGRWMTTPFGDA